jgi:isopenicillin N synthase-like dioxygenase
MHEAIDAPAISSIDLGAFLNGTTNEQAEIAAAVDELCRSTGFLIIENHQVPAQIINNAWTATRAFFDLPLEEKLAAKSVDPKCPRGYFPMASEALAKSLGVDTPPDIKESFGIGPLNAPPIELTAAEHEFYFGDNLWPASLPNLEGSLTTYFDAMTELCGNVLRLFAAALEMPHDYFENFHTYPMSALRCINYPGSDEPLLPMQKGAGEHSDYGSITILKSDPNIPGLEIRLASGEWAIAPLVDDAFIVNIGDMMARWTNDRWVSTLHRVIQASAPEGGPARRQSMAFFDNTNLDSVIECIPSCLAPGEQPKYEKVLSGPYLQSRFESAID